MPNAYLGPEVQQAAAALAAAVVNPEGPLCVTWESAVAALPTWRAKMRSGATAAVEQSMLDYVEKVHAALCSTAGAVDPSAAPCSTAGAVDPSFAEAAYSALETASKLLTGAKMAEWLADARNVAQQAARRKAAKRAATLATECTTSWSPNLIDECHAALGQEQPVAEDMGDAERDIIGHAIENIEHWIGDQAPADADVNLLRKAVAVIRRFAVFHGSQEAGPLAEVERAVSCLAARGALVDGSAQQRPSLMGELQRALAACAVPEPVSADESCLVKFTRAARSWAQECADEGTAEQIKAAEAALTKAHEALRPVAGGATDGSVWKAGLEAEGAALCSTAGAVDPSLAEAAWQKLMTRAQETLFQVDAAKMSKAHKDLKKA